LFHAIHPVSTPQKSLPGRIHNSLGFNGGGIKMFNFLKNQPESKPSFNILDVSTWDSASDSVFIWKNDITFFNEDNDKNITEKEFSIFIGQVIGKLRQFISDKNLSIAGLSNIITLIIDLLSSGINTTNVLLLINMGFENNIDFSWQFFKTNQTTGGNNKRFDINNQETWQYATENNLIWEGTPFNISPDKKFTEILFVKIMALEFYTFLQDLYSRPDLRKLYISTLLENLKQNENITDILNQIKNQLENINASRIIENEAFEIFDIDTWDHASTRPFFWKDKMLFSADDRKAITEKNLVDLFHSMFKFLERDGDRLTLTQRTQAITHVLDRTAKYQSDPALMKSVIEDDINDEKHDPIPKNIFDPQNQKTWSFASNRPLVIDGVSIFNTYQDATGKEVKENETEKGFVFILSHLLETYKKGIVWEEAVNLVKPDFTFEGKEPNQETPGYSERVNEVYQSILKNPAVRLTKKQEEGYIGDYIKRRVTECTAGDEE
jgi:hypothetical protein